MLVGWGSSSLGRMAMLLYISVSTQALPSHLEADSEPVSLAYLNTLFFVAIDRRRSQWLSLLAPEMWTVV